MGSTKTANWCSDLEQVIIDSKLSQTASMEDLIYRTFELIQCAPAVAKGAFSSIDERHVFEMLILSGGHESAAIKLLCDIPFMLSRGPTGDGVATVCLPGKTEISYQAKTPVTALCGALCLAMLQAYSPTGWLDRPDRSSDS